MINKIKTYIEARRRKKLIARIRSHLAFFGHDTSIMTDDEVEERVSHMGVILSRAAQVTGLTADEARSALLKLGSID